MGKLIQQFIKKVSRPWGMSIEELQQLQEEVIYLNKENDRLGRLCDKLNKDYFKEKEISMYGMQELSNAMRTLKLERGELAIEKLKEVQNVIGTMNVRTGNANNCLNKIYSEIDLIIKDLKGE